MPCSVLSEEYLTSMLTFAHNDEISSTYFVFLQDSFGFAYGYIYWYSYYWLYGTDYKHVGFYPIDMTIFLFSFSVRIQLIINHRSGRRRYLKMKKNMMINIIYFLQLWISINPSIKTSTFIRPQVFIYNSRMIMIL